MFYKEFSGKHHFLLDKREFLISLHAIAGLLLFMHPPFCTDRRLRQLPMNIYPLQRLYYTSGSDKQSTNCMNI